MASYYTSPMKSEKSFSRKQKVTGKSVGEYVSSLEEQIKQMTQQIHDLQSYKELYELGIIKQKQPQFIQDMQNLSAEKLKPEDDNVKILSETVAKQQLEKSELLRILDEYTETIKKLERENKALLDYAEAVEDTKEQNGAKIEKLEARVKELDIHKVVVETSVQTEKTQGVETVMEVVQEQTANLVEKHIKEVMFYEDKIKNAIDKVGQKERELVELRVANHEKCAKLSQAIEELEAKQIALSKENHYLTNSLQEAQSKLLGVVEKFENLQSKHQALAHTRQIENEEHLSQLKELELLKEDEKRHIANIEKARDDIESMKEALIESNSVIEDLEIRNRDTLRGTELALHRIRSELEDIFCHVFPSSFEAEIDIESETNICLNLIKELAAEIRTAKENACLASTLEQKVACLVREKQDRERLLSSVINRLQNSSIRELALGMVELQETLHKLQRDSQANNENWEVALSEIKNIEEDLEKRTQLEENIKMFEKIDSRIQFQIEEILRKLKEDERVLRNQVDYTL